MSSASWKLLLVSAAVITSGAAFAQADWPTKPVRIVVPFAAGGTTDITTRVIADELTKAVKGSFIVDNKGGAGGNVGAAQVARATPDGYTFLMGTPGTQVINQFLYPKLVIERFKGLGAEPVGGTPEQLGQFIAAETGKWSQVVKASGAKID